MKRYKDFQKELPSSVKLDEQVRAHWTAHFTELELADLRKKFQDNTFRKLEKVRKIYLELKEDEKKLESEMKEVVKKDWNDPNFKVKDRKRVQRNFGKSYQSYVSVEMHRMANGNPPHEPDYWGE